MSEDWLQNEFLCLELYSEIEVQPMKSKLINIFAIFGTVFLSIILAFLTVLLIVILISLFYKQDTSFFIPLILLVLMLIIDVILFKTFTCNIVIAIWNQDGNLTIKTALRYVNLCVKNVRLYDKSNVLIIKEYTGHHVTRRYILYKFYFKQEDVEKFILTIFKQISDMNININLN